MLISVPGYIEGLGDSKARDDIKATIDYLLNLQTPSGNFPCAMDEIPPNRTRPESEELVHWCHGAPGMIYLLVSIARPRETLYNYCQILIFRWYFYSDIKIDF